MPNNHSYPHFQPYRAATQPSSSGLRYIGAKADQAQPLRNRGQSAPNPRVTSLTQHFFLRGEEQEATQYKNVILDPDDMPEPRPEFDSFDKVPRSWKPLWAVLGVVLVGVVGVATWRSFHLLSRPGSTIQAASRAMVSARPDDPAFAMAPTPRTAPAAQQSVPAAQAGPAQQTVAATAPAQAQPFVPPRTAPAQQTAAPPASAPAAEPPASPPAVTATATEPAVQPPASESAAEPSASAAATGAPAAAPPSESPAPAAAAATAAQAPSRMPGDGARNGGDKPKLRSRPLRGYVWSPATNGLVPAYSVPEATPPASGVAADPASSSAPSSDEPPAATSPGRLEGAPKPARESAPILE